MKMHKQADERLLEIKNGESNTKLGFDNSEDYYEDEVWGGNLTVVAAAAL